MYIQKCDLCNKEIEGGKHVSAGFGYGRKEFCRECGLPVLKFLKRNKFLKEEIENKIKKL